MNPQKSTPETMTISDRTLDIFTRVQLMHYLATLTPHPLVTPPQSLPQRLQVWTQISTAHLGPLTYIYILCLGTITPILIAQTYSPPSPIITRLIPPIIGFTIFLVTLINSALQTCIRNRLTPHLYAPFYQRHGNKPIWSHKDTHRILLLHAASLLTPTIITIFLLNVGDPTTATHLWALTATTKAIWYGLYSATMIKTIDTLIDDIADSNELAGFIQANNIIATRHDNDNGLTICYQ